MRIFSLLSIAVFATNTTYSQSCPKSDAQGPGEAAEASILHGTLTYHDELRQWLGLKLDRPACDETEIQLVFSDTGAWRRAESLRRCAITVNGKLYQSPTGYFSANLAISDPELKPDPSCHPFPIKSDPTKEPIPANVKIFRASITVDYRGRGHIDVSVSRDDAKLAPLKPWQAFIYYYLTGSQDVMWFGCREGFQTKKITQKPKSSTGIFQDEPDMNSVVLSMDAPNTVAFTCEKEETTNNREEKRRLTPPKK